MVYKRLRFQYWLRCLCILITAGASAVVLRDYGMTAFSVILLCLLVYQTVRLLIVMERPQRDFIRFLEAIEYSDFSQSFSSVEGDTSLKPLRDAFDRVIRAFQKAREEKESQYRYLQTIIQHIGAGIIVFRIDGTVDLVNPQAKKILGIPQIRHIDRLGECDGDLPERLRKLDSGDRIQVHVKKYGTGESITLTITATRFILQNESLTMVSIQNIQSELEEKELEAWQNLIRVLTHEIMNSITPIASLASTANQLLGKIGDRFRSEPESVESMGDMTQAIATIESRSRGLLKFVESYRELTRIPKPEFSIVRVQELFDRVAPLMQTCLDARSIRFTQAVDPVSLEITADRNLIEQVLINLLQNAADWIGSDGGGRVELLASMDEGGRPAIMVRDNGPGIQKEAIEKIFIPFFSTKPNGSGIGLSLSRQIMRLHHGTISVNSTPDANTIFTLKF